MVHHVTIICFRYFIHITFITFLKSEDYEAHTFEVWLVANPCPRSKPVTIGSACRRLLPTNLLLPWWDASKLKSRVLWWVVLEVSGGCGCLVLCELGEDRFLYIGGFNQVSDADDRSWKKHFWTGGFTAGTGYLFR